MRLNVIVASKGAVSAERTGACLAEAALSAGYRVRTVLLSGKAAGGGYALHIRVTDRPVRISPVIPEGHADLILADSPPEALRQLSYLKKEGRAAVVPETREKGKEMPPDRPEPCLRFLRRRVKGLLLLEKMPEDRRECRALALRLET